MNGNTDKGKTVYPSLLQNVGIRLTYKQIEARFQKYWIEKGGPSIKGKPPVN